MDTKEKERSRRSQSTRTGASGQRSSTKPRAAGGNRDHAPAKTASTQRKSAGTQTKQTASQTSKVSTQSSKTGTQTRNSTKKQTQSTKRGTANSARRVAAGEKTKQSATTKRRRTSPRNRKSSIADSVVYLPPKPFNRNRLLLRLATVVAVVLALVLGISVFFKVEAVVVSGNQKYSPEDILKASEIQYGDNLLTFSRSKAGGRVIGKLPYVENIRFGIKLPGTVNIEITEVEVGYATADTNGDWWLISSGGKILEQLSSGANTGYTNVLGIKLENPAVGLQAVALEEQSVQTDEEGNTIPVTVTADKKLKTALNILQYLEQNGIVGEAASVDISDLGNIRMQYGHKYQIQLGNDTDLFQKIAHLKSAVAKISAEYPYSTGSLDISNLSNIRYKEDKT